MGPPSAVPAPRTPSPGDRKGKNPQIETPQVGASETPQSPSRRRLSAAEFKAYDAAIKALAAANMTLTLEGQNALRDIIKNESRPRRAE